MSVAGKGSDFVGKLFDLTGRVAIITGGGGLLGRKHAEAIAGAGGIPVLVDIYMERAEATAKELAGRFGVAACALQCDITKPEAVEGLLADVLKRYGRVDILVNNAANNPKVEVASKQGWSRFESFSLKQWEEDMAVGVTGAFLCCQIIGSEMARRKRGVIINIASFFSVVAPDQRVYREGGLPEEQQPVKPVSYSVVKTGIIGLTNYLATYWAQAGIRVNAISPGGVFNGQPEEFVRKIAELTPMGRMGNPDEFQGALLYLCADASSYVTGINLVVDGGRVVW
jgi:NAD(P)-dependent dehydrogenase (short-subunit alcohol dehydrogenase family)